MASAAKSPALVGVVEARRQRGAVYTQRIENSTWARIPADSFPRCSNIMRLLIKDASRREARRSTENPEGDGSRTDQLVAAAVA